MNRSRSTNWSRSRGGHMNRRRSVSRRCMRCGGMIGPIRFPGGHPRHVAHLEWGGSRPRHRDFRNCRRWCARHGDFGGRWRCRRRRKGCSCLGDKREGFSRHLLRVGLGHFLSRSLLHWRWRTCGQSCWRHLGGHRRKGATARSPLVRSGSESLTSRRCRCLCRGRQFQALAVLIKWARDFFRHFDLPLHATSGD